MKGNSIFIDREFILYRIKNGGKSSNRWANVVTIIYHKHSTGGISMSNLKVMGLSFALLAAPAHAWWCPSMIRTGFASPSEFTKGAVVGGLTAGAVVGLYSLYKKGTIKKVVSRILSGIYEHPILTTAVLATGAALVLMYKKGYFSGAGEALSAAVTTRSADTSDKAVQAQEKQSATETKETPKTSSTNTDTVTSTAADKRGMKKTGNTGKTKGTKQTQKGKIKPESTVKDLPTLNTAVSTAATSKAPAKTLEVSPQEAPVVKEQPKIDAKSSEAAVSENAQEATAGK
jgi:hypothetical protein